MVGLLVLWLKIDHKVYPLASKRDKMPVTGGTTPETPQRPRGAGKVGGTFKCWSKADKLRVIRSIMVELVDGKPPHGTLARIARAENVGQNRIQRLWQKFRSPTEGALSNPKLTCGLLIWSLGRGNNEFLLRTLRAGPSVCSSK